MELAPLLFPSYDAARSAIRYTRNGQVVRGRGGKEYGGSQPRQKGIGTIPPSEKEPWRRVELDPGRYLILSDAHIPYHDEGAVNAALDYGDGFNPTHVLLNGDIADFFALSRWQTDPTRRNLSKEIGDLDDFLHHLAARYPKAQIIYRNGNHELRWRDYVWRRCEAMAGIVQHWSKNLTPPRTTFYEDDELLTFNRLCIVHGHEFGKGSPILVNPARSFWLRSTECVLGGHHHRTSQHEERSMLDRQIASYSTGCLCQLTPRYERVNRWNHGFATLEAEKGGDWDIRNLKIIKGKVY
jgi:predicted phosphodiesterase